MTKAFKRMVIALLLIIDGIVLMNVFFFHYSYETLNSQDKQLMYVAQVIDASIAGMIETYENEMEFMINQERFVEAENEWRQTGNVELLQKELLDNHIMSDQRNENLLLSIDGKVELMANKKTTYTLLDNIGTEQVRFYTDENGDYYVSFDLKRDDIIYSALVSAEEFYQRVQGMSRLNESWLILSDSERKVIMFPQDDYLMVGELDAISGATRGKEGLEKFSGGGGEGLRKIAYL